MRSGWCSAAIFRASSLLVARPVFSYAVSNKNPMSSLKTAMVQDRDLIASYPYSHVQSTPLNFTGVIASSGQKASLVLQQFINSDLCGIMVSITQVSDMFSVAGIANKPDCQMMSNIELRFNGQPIYVSLYQEHLLTNLFNEQQDSSIQASYITPSSTSPFTSFPRVTILPI